VTAGSRVSERTTLLPFYFAVAFVFSWSCWLFPLLAARGEFSLSASARVGLLVGGAFGPFVAAFAALYRRGGWPAMLAFARRSLQYRIGLRFLLAALFLVPALAVAAAFLHAQRGGPPFAFVVTLREFPWLFLTLFFVGGSVEEEFGWAYAIDGMQQRWGLLPSALALGAVWGCWHLPLFFITGLSQSYMPFWAFLTMTISLRTIYVWAYEGTGKSILTTLLFHTSTNVAFNLVTLLDRSAKADQRGFIYFALLSTIPALILASRSRLYHEPGKSQAFPAKYPH
jgi:uncharacterized protein